MLHEWRLVEFCLPHVGKKFKLDPGHSDCSLSIAVESTDFARTPATASPSRHTPAWESDTVQLFMSFSSVLPGLYKALNAVGAWTVSTWIDCHSHSTLAFPEAADTV